jgi:hypothetical protein
LWSPCGFDARTQLAVLHFNALREAEDRGERVVMLERHVYSKAKGGMVKKKVKTPVLHTWKKDIVEAACEKKLENMLNVPEENVDDDFDRDIEIDADTLIQQVIDLGLEDENDNMDIDL